MSKPKRLKPLHTWRILAGPKVKKYWLVLLFSNTDDLNRWIVSMSSKDRWAHQQLKRSRTRAYAAICLTFQKPPARNCLGYVAFAANFFGSGFVAHEMVHAGLRTHGFGFGTRLSRT